MANAEKKPDQKILPFPERSVPLRKKKPPNSEKNMGTI